MEFREGFYRLYYTGNHGSGIMLLCMKAGYVVGMDALGGKVSGTYVLEGGDANLDLNFEFAAGTLVTGQTLPQAMAINSKPSIGLGVFHGEVARVDIGTGPVNARAEFACDPI